MELFRLESFAPMVNPVASWEVKKQPLRKVPAWGTMIFLKKIRFGGIWWVLEFPWKGRCFVSLEIGISSQPCLLENYREIVTIGFWWQFWGWKIDFQYPRSRLVRKQRWKSKQHLNFRVGLNIEQDRTWRFFSWRTTCFFVESPEECKGNVVCFFEFYKDLRIFCT